ncbi:hypothetical protein UVI_02022220 [Ustilaginoidea virens]|uniref:Uncharacterized protein n=1 Tax=Ustilaginoidea virens TaxID=1159556 RepID=A0A1B5L0R7_USTVR|nr:hypothetical protein UVI_02022220 [Ustilaginoidea virens]
MLAAHRDQENLVHGHHHAPSKQQPKTPGARYPKTPGNFGRNDENAPSIFAGKNAADTGVRMAGNGKSVLGKPTGQRQALVTPLENRNRAPLGNKTTNAKARPGHTVAVKDRVREIENTQIRQTSMQKPKQRPVDLQPQKLTMQPDDMTGTAGAPEPEYAPPRPTPLPYESDVLPAAGLTFNGLKRSNILKGYYQHFHNPLDENGVSRIEKKFNDEMKALFKKAEDRNAEDIAAINWSPEDISEATESDLGQGHIRNKVEACSAANSALSVTQKQPSTLSARRAASALAVRAESQSRSLSRSFAAKPMARRPLSSAFSASQVAKPTGTKSPSVGNSIGETASRTTLGYNKGRSASSMMHSRSASQSNAHQNHTTRHAVSLDVEPELTITPARLRQAAASNTQAARPKFMSIFDDADDDDLLPLQKQFLPSDDEDDEFELKLTL